MIEKIRYTIIIIFVGIGNVLAQDSSVYELQRTKINALLAERSTKFGQYDESLNTRTGIFGFQTKRDIKNSNEILRQIALNDNAIFKELKVLLEYKDLQMQEVKMASITNDERIQNYRRTIKDLQVQNQELSNGLKKTEKDKDLAFILLLFFGIANGFLVYFVIRKRSNSPFIQNN